MTRATSRQFRVWPLLLAGALASLLADPPTVRAQITPAPAPQRQVLMANGPRGMVPYVVDRSGTRINLPVNQRGRPIYSRHGGYRLSVEPVWPGAYGYRPVVFTLRRQKPTVADEQITIKFSAGDWYPPREEAINVTQHFVFPAGATTQSFRMLVPKYQDLQTAAWEVLIDGRSDDFLAVDRIHLSMLVAGQQANSGVMGLGLTPEQESIANAVLQTAAGGASVGMRSMTAARLPDDWREYSSVDVFVMPAAQLGSLAAQHPHKLEALLRWVKTGGNIWLLEAGKRWENLDAAETALGQTMGRDNAAEPIPSDTAIVQRGWKFPTIGQRSTEASQGALLLAGFDTGQPKRMPSLLGAVLERFQISPWAWEFVVRGHGLGVVTAFRGNLDKAADGNAAAAAAINFSASATYGGADPMAAASMGNSPEDTYSLITQSLLGPRLAWTTRHGNQPESSNEDFNNLLIPGVGVAPVTQFQFLVTLFAVVIGPLNYWLLKRKNKLPLLLATVPMAAAATTLLLFLYGLFADGFSVRARARTLTLLDQRAGEAVSWGRLSYYAGIAPRDGLNIPRDQLMYPIMPSWLSRRYGGRATSPPRHLEWQDEQLLTRGWLASRTPTQYQAVTSRPSEKRLDLRVTDDGLRIDNRLGVDVTHVAIEDHDGRFYWCENLANGRRKVVAATDVDKLLSGIRRLFTENLPENPVGDDGYSVSYGYQLSESLMEGRLSAINDPAIRSWGRGKYIAFTKHAVELDLGLGDVKEEASFHVIEGTW